MDLAGWAQTLKWFKYLFNFGAPSGALADFLIGFLSAGMLDCVIERVMQLISCIDLMNINLYARFDSSIHYYLLHGHKYSASILYVRMGGSMQMKCKTNLLIL